MDIIDHLFPDQDEGADRREVIRVQEVYFRDFLTRCNDYEITNVKLRPPVEEDDLGEASASRPPDLAKMNQERDAKIKR